MKLNQIKISGYKSIHPDGQTIDFGDITVLLGQMARGRVI